MGRPLIAVSMGDPEGIGPEVAVKALRRREVQRACRPLLIGLPSVFRRYGWNEGVAPVLPIGLDSAFPFAERERGALSFKAFSLGARLAMRGRVRAVVTAPISKTAWKKAGIAYPDHTSYLEKAAGVPHVEMAFAAGSLRAVVVTRHRSLLNAIRDLSVEKVVQAALLFARSFSKAPKLVLCGLNPHAGEGGLFGGEEDRILRPAAALLRKKGIQIDGPVAADSAWEQHYKGRYDGLVALYHDQALMPLKVAASGKIVNWTIGLPMVRTSPAHGTAFDIAGKGVADPSSMIEAILFAASLSRRNTLRY
ncbi:MAG: hypothetical protein A3G41_01940 [Elusimicrobia bacterium RIFCSPLOWO2_12_FULL_59_9]|nr:MAG: hypothetical protein A3G41_01940 [Elusimicrobia bacterium RIFCSPLOWO2_12_FULL_59_9]